MTDTVDTRSEAERRVRQVWPNSRCHYYPNAGRFKVRVGRFRSLIIGTGRSVGEAYRDAASRLERKEQENG